MEDDKILMLAGKLPGFREVKFNHPDYDYARFLRKHGAINYWTCLPPVGDIGVNVHYSDQARTKPVGYSIIDNSMKQKMRIFLREDLWR